MSSREAHVILNGWFIGYVGDSAEMGPKKGQTMEELDHGSSEDCLLGFMTNRSWDSGLVRRSRFEGYKDDESSFGNVGLHFLILIHVRSMISGQRYELDIDLGISVKSWV